MSNARMDIPSDLYDELQRVATQHGVTVTAVMQQFIKLGLLVCYVNDREDARVILEEPDGAKEIRFFDKVTS